ncbi:MAG: bifunctional phosphoglucose/phosphomannose isomerase [Candidatus Moraniibacteriota bacterium]
MEEITLDKSHFREVILGTPDQLAAGFDLAESVSLPEGFTSLTISGMGGSALPADVLRTFLFDIAEASGESVVPVYQNRGYAIQAGALVPGTLHVLSSYSGNTEETLETFQEVVIERKLPALALSAGGTLKELSEANGIAHITLPMPDEHFQPRMGTGYFLGVLLGILGRAGLIPDVRSQVVAAAEELKEALPRLEEAGKLLAEKMKGSTPILYASEKFRSVAMIGKIKINENAKTPAFYNVFPELNHNEMVGFSLPQGPFFVLMLRDPADHPRNRKRYELTLELLQEKGLTGEVLDMEGESVYNKVLMSLGLLDFASYYLALAYGQDPTPVDMVEALKGKLKA